MTVAEELKKLHEATREDCRKDILYFIKTFGHIEDKDADELIQPFKLWPAQEEACLSIMENKLNVILKARQLGITWLALHIAAWYLVLFTGRTVLALSKTEDDAKELIRRLEVILDNMPLIYEKKKAQPGWQGPVYESTALSITVHWPDGPDCVFKGFASSAGAGRSFTADLFIFDEWAFHQFAEKIWMSGFPTINRPNGGKFTGDWDNGKLVEGSGKYEFADGLKFEEPNKWNFCTYKDRRFYHEQIHGVDNPNIEKYAKKLNRYIPEGCYDTGDGYYNPEKGTVFTYENVYLREPNEEEEEWIKLKCRYNPKKDEITEENQEQIEKDDEVISNILREYQFSHYQKAGEVNEKNE